MHGILLLNAAQARNYLLLQAISNSVILVVAVPVL